MVDWTMVQDTWTIEPRNFDKVDSDGVDLYWQNDDFGITHYDVSGDVETEIYTDGTAPILYLWSFCIFKGDIYIMGRNSTSPFPPSVFKYDGTPNNWTSVDVLRADATSGTYGNIFCNDDWMVATHVDYDEGRTTVSHYTTNGTGWSVASFGTTPKMSQGGGPTAIEPQRMPGSRPVINTFCTANSGVPNRTCTNDVLMKFTGTAWSDIDNPAVEECRMVAPEADTCWTWEPQGGDGTYSEVTEDAFDVFVPTNDDVNTLLLVDFPESLGYDNIGSNCQLYKWDGSSWQTWDLITDLNQYPSEDTSWVARMDNNDCYMMTYNTHVSFALELWKRDEPYVAGPTANRLWVYSSVDDGSNWSSRGVQT